MGVYFFEEVGMQKVFRATGAHEAGNGRWSVNFREVIDQVAPGAPAPVQDTFSITMSLEDAVATLGQDQVMTLAPAVQG